MIELVQRKPDADCVARVEELLEQCRRGEVVALGYAAILAADDGVQTSFVQPRGVNAFTLLGAFERLKLRFHNAVIAENA